MKISIEKDGDKERREKNLQNITDIIAGRLAEKRKAKFKKMKKEVWK